MIGQWMKWITVVEPTRRVNASLERISYVCIVANRLCPINFRRRGGHLTKCEILRTIFILRNGINCMAVFSHFWCRADCAVDCLQTSVLRSGGCILCGSENRGSSKVLRHSWYLQSRMRGWIWALDLTSLKRVSFS